MDSGICLFYGKLIRQVDNFGVNLMEVKSLSGAVEPTYIIRYKMLILDESVKAIGLPLLFP